MVIAVVIVIAVVVRIALLQRGGNSRTVVSDSC
jgi:hypothetical protein